MTCDCCKEEIHKIYHETETVYKANARLEQEIESLNACIEELQEKLEKEKKWNRIFVEKMLQLDGELNEKESKVACTADSKCQCWHCVTGA